jgi:hypothetical protein
VVTAFISSDEIFQIERDVALLQIATAAQLVGYIA